MWPDKEHTDDLLEQAKQGDAEAAERLLGEFREPLRRVVDLRLDPALARRLRTALRDALREVGEPED